MRPLALTAATLHVVLCALAALVLLFLATFPWENESPERAEANAMLFAGGLALALLAVVVAGAAVARRPSVGAAAIGGQLVVGALLLAVDVQASRPGDGIPSGGLMVYLLAVGLSAVVATRATQRER